MDAVCVRVLGCDFKVFGESSEKGDANHVLNLRRALKLEHMMISRIALSRVRKSGEAPTDGFQEMYEYMFNNVCGNTRDFIIA